MVSTFRSTCGPAPIPLGRGSQPAQARGLGRGARIPLAKRRHLPGQREAVPAPKEKRGDKKEKEGGKEAGGGGGEKGEGGEPNDPLVGTTAHVPYGGGLEL